MFFAFFFAFFISFSIFCHVSIVFRPRRWAPCSHTARVARAPGPRRKTRKSLGLEKRENPCEKRRFASASRLGLFGSTAFEVVVVLHGAVPHLAKVGRFLWKSLRKSKKCHVTKHESAISRIHTNATQAFRHSKLPNIYTKTLESFLKETYQKIMSIHKRHVGHFKGQLASWQSGPPPSSEGLKSFEGQKRPTWMEFLTLKWVDARSFLMIKLTI